MPHTSFKSRRPARIQRLPDFCKSAEVSGRPENGVYVVAYSRSAVIAAYVQHAREALVPNPEFAGEADAEAVMSESRNRVRYVD